MNQNQSLTNLKQFQILSGSTLKLIAIITMFIDHIGAAILYQAILLPNAPISKGTTLYTIYLIYRIMRFIGRLSFPIFCFLLVQGFLYTSDRKKYALRLATFAILSEIPFDLALHDQLITFEYQNVFFTLWIGLLVLILLERCQSYPLLQLLAAAVGMAAAELLKTDYGYHGIILIAAFYFFRFYPKIQTFAGCLLLLWEAPACLALIPINMYNHKRGLSLKYVFYLFYPVHLLLLACIRFLYNAVL